jgi:uncharacterized protein (DUF433 family)
MSNTIWGVVQDGKIIPQTPLPDGLQVRITVPEEVAIPGEFRAELDARSLGNAEVLAMVESVSRDAGTASSRDFVVDNYLAIEVKAASMSPDADGVIRVGGTRVTLDTVVAAYRDGATAEEISRQYPSLELVDVYAAIVYYLRRRSEVEAYLSEREARAAMIRRDNESRFDPAGVRERLLARRGPEGER